MISSMGYYCYGLDFVDAHYEYWTLPDIIVPYLSCMFPCLARFGSFQYF